jgi:restriction endonuclease S subunit
MKKICLVEAANISSGLVINRYTKLNKVSLLKNPYIYYHITLKSVENNNIDLDLLEKIESKREIDDRYFLKKGDIIIKLTPPYNAALVDFEYEHVIVPQNFAIIRTNENFDSEYLSYILNSKNIQNQLLRHAEGGSVPIIKINSLNEVKIRSINMDMQVKYAKLFRLISHRNCLKKRNIELEGLLTENILSNL